MDLTGEALDNITKFLDKASFYSLACAHPRFRVICENSFSFRTIGFRILNDFSARFISFKASNLSGLDLSNCWSDRGCMTALIGKFPRLSKLNVVNSSLTLADLRDAI